MKLTAILASILGVLILFAAVAGLWTMSTTNRANSLQVTYKMKLKANTATFDNMKKQISQVAQVSDAQLAKLQEIYNSYAEARTPEGDNGSLMRWTQESVPTVDTSTMNNVQNIIVASRNGWTRNQIEIIDIAGEYNQMLVNAPASWLLGLLHYQEIDPKVITSADTKAAFENGEDNDTNVFQKK